MHRNLPSLLALLLTLGGPSGCAGEAGVDEDGGDAGEAALTLDEPRARVLLDELNARRSRAGMQAVVPHPALGELARWRASLAAETGSADSTVALLDEMKSRLRRGGYQAHRWIAGLAISSGTTNVAIQLDEMKPAWYEEAAREDFEHIGIGIERAALGDGERLVYVVVLAQTRKTVELRQAAPLADLAEVRRVVLEAVNAARAEHGRRPLASAPLLDEAAQKHAEDMLRRAFYDHTNPDGLTPMARVRAAGFRRGSSISENIAKGLFEPRETVRRWLDSPGHRANILHRRAHSMGVGVAFGDSVSPQRDNANGFEVLWAQVFAGN